MCCSHQALSDVSNTEIDNQRALHPSPSTIHSPLSIPACWVATSTSCKHHVGWASLVVGHHFDDWRNEAINLEPARQITCPGQRAAAPPAPSTTSTTNSIDKWARFNPLHSRFTFYKGKNCKPIQSEWLMSTDELSTQQQQTTTTNKYSKIKIRKQLKGYINFIIYSIIINIYFVLLSEIYVWENKIYLLLIYLFIFN